MAIAWSEDAERTSPASSRGDKREAKAPRRWVGWAFAILGTAVAAYLVYNTAESYDFDDVAASVAEIRPARLALAFLFAGLSYLCLTLSDYVSLRAVGKPLAYRRAALASFISLSIGHSVGFAGLSSGAIRYRFYLRWGLNAEQVTKLVLFCGMTVALGLASLGGVALLLGPAIAHDVAGLDELSAITLGASCLAACALYVVLSALFRRPLRIWRWHFALPGPRIALAQIAVGTVNFALVAACLHQALLSVAEVGYGEVAAAYVMANVATLVTHVPGGLGVIESVVTYALPGAKVLGAVLVFRFVYFLVPLAIGGATFALSEVIFRARDRRSETD